MTGLKRQVPSGAATANAVRVYLGEAADAYAAGVTAERDRIRLSPELRGATFLARDGDGREIAAVPWSVITDVLRDAMTDQIEHAGPDVAAGLEQP